MSSTPSGPDCSKCNGLCCRHVALPIDPPKTKQDIDNIRWYLMHENIKVFLDHENDWCVEFITDCKKLGEDHRCSDYFHRPKICRDYPGDDEECEFESEDPPYQKVFTSVEEFEQYLDAKGKKWKYKFHGK